MPPESSKATNLELAAYNNEEEKLSVVDQSQKAESNRQSQVGISQKNSMVQLSQDGHQSPMQFGHNFSQDKISLGATD